MKRTTLLLVAVQLLVPLAFSQEPTYEQTRKWIVSKMTDEGGYTTDAAGVTFTGSYEQVSMDDCKLQFTSVLYSSGLGILHEQPTVTSTLEIIPLDKVTSVKDRPGSFHRDMVEKGIAARVTGDYYSVEIRTSEKLITMKSTEKQGDKVVSQEVEPPIDADEIKFGRSLATDEDLANRMQKALSHAVSLCTKPKEKEPF